MLLVTAAEMRRLDALTIAQGTPGYTLMQRAAAGAVQVLLESFKLARGRRVLVVAGKGNNGGDGLVMARLLQRKGLRPVVALLATRSAVTGDAALALAALRRTKIPLIEMPTLRDLGKLSTLIESSAVVIDAILGTGLNTSVGGLYAAAIDIINAAALPVLAVDIPSGLDADRGVPLGAAVHARVTVTFGCAKLGQFLHPAPRYVGALAVTDIGITPQALDAVQPRQRWLDAAAAAALLAPRQADSHKGTYGHVLVVAGGRGHTGAGLIAARAACRSGSGLVTLAGPASLNVVFSSSSPEVMTLPLADNDGLIAFDAGALRAALTGKSAVAVGPGLGTHTAAHETLAWLLQEATMPLLIDADGITCVARAPDILRAARAPVVLTPHPGEMARLAGCATTAIQADRVGAARRVADEYGVTVVLKGSRTIIASPGGALTINSTGNPGMATGGMGDALSGIITALLGQGLAAANAACLGVYLHGDAGDALARVRGPVGILASDVIEEVPAAVARLLALR